MTDRAQDTPNASTLDAAQVRLRENLASFDAEVDWQMSSEAERADLWEEIDVNVDDLRTVLDALAALQQQLSEARAELKNRWQRMDSAPRDGTRILLAWEPYSGISEHVELGKWKSQNGWCNTYGKPFSGEPDAWAALAPFSLSPEAAEAKLATMAKPVDPKAIQALTRHQKQLDEDGVMVGVSRQALDELLAGYAALSKRDAPQAQVDERDAFEEWALKDFRELTPLEFEERTPGNNQYYESDANNEAYIGWTARASANTFGQGSSAMAEDLEQRLREAEARLRDNLRSFDLEVEFQLSNDGERADLWTDIDVNVEDLRTLLDAHSTSRERSEALEKALEPFAKAAEGYDPPEGDDELLAWGGDYITIGMLRSALAALSLKQEGKGNG